MQDAQSNLPVCVCVHDNHHTGRHEPITISQAVDWLLGDRPVQAVLHCVRYGREQEVLGEVTLQVELEANRSRQGDAEGSS